MRGDETVILLEMMKQLHIHLQFATVREDAILNTNIKPILLVLLYSHGHLRIHQTEHCRLDLVQCSV